MTETHTHRKLEAHERNWKARRWQHFGLTKRGRMSWADWFHMRHLDLNATYALRGGNDHG